MSTQYQIPLSTGPQQFNIQLGANTYQFVITWRDNALGGWSLDINTTSGAPIVSGIAMVPSVDLLAPYPYLGFGGSLYLIDNINPANPATFASLGVSSWLYYVTNP